MSNPPSPAKPYFAKYLPFHGEIKEGDKYLFAGEVLTAPKEFKNHDEGADGHRTKVKLFLCSRDIQVNDKKIHTPRGIGECILRRPSPRFKTHDVVAISFGDGDDDTEVYALNEFEAYKVIGEISPAATWVKEGDELDEEDWRLTTTIFNECVELEKEALNKLLQDNKQYRIEIKGSNGDYH